MNENERMRRALDEVREFLSGRARSQIAVLKREKEEQVAAQNFEAAIELNVQIKEQEAYWAAQQLLARVTGAQPITVSPRDRAARDLLRAVQDAGSWLSAALEDPNACPEIKLAFRRVLSALADAEREDVGRD